MTIPGKSDAVAIEGFAQQRIQSNSSKAKYAGTGFSQPSFE
jgi:hypothetical protein